MKQSVIFSAILFIICSHSLIAGDSLTIIDKRVNFGYAVSQNRKVDAVIVHSTFNNSGFLILNFSKAIKLSKYPISLSFP